MKPRIFINMPYMEMGGAERALIGLLNALDTERVDVDLFVNQHSGAFMKLIPEKINLIQEIDPYPFIRQPIKHVIKKRKLKIAYLRYKALKEYKRDEKERKINSCVNHYVMNRLIKYLPPLDFLGRYNLAISFIDPSHIIHDKVLADKRLEWLHTDFSGFRMDERCMDMTWGRDDYIVAISQDMADSFKKRYTQYADKVIMIENILSPETVRQEAENGTADEMDGCNVLKLLSIGRICHAKYFERIPDVAVIMKQLGLKFKWFIVGPGDASGIIKRAKELGVDELIQFTGPKSNPYPYIKACDMYVQPSRREGKSVTVREAQIMGKPVIITRYATSGSQVIDGIDGIICEMDNESVARAIFDLSNDEKQRQRITDYLSSHDYGNESEVEKIYDLIYS